MRSRRTTGAVPAMVLTVLLAALLSGCVGMPQEGPVVDADVSSGTDSQQASDIDAVPPARDASALEIADGFLDAMTASPIAVDVARQFLAASAAGSWNPRAATITYAGKGQPRSSGTDVVVQLVGAELLDDSGARQGQLPRAEQRLRLDMVLEDGQYRIDDPPDALIVPASWFEQRFSQASLYFFDRSAEVLVPEPVFVPRGQQLATTLIEGLLAGPGPDLGRVARTFLPPRLAVGLSVPISPDGVADIALQGDPGSLTPQTVERMYAQLAWTLRQEPGINALRLTIGGAAIRLPSGQTEYFVDEAVQYDPTGAQSSTRLFGLRGGMLAVGSDAELEPVGGPLGTGTVDLRSVGVSLDATQAAGITADGTGAVLAPIDPQDDEPDSVRTVRTGATDLLKPAWDLGGRVWMLDRTASGAAVGYLRDGVLEPVEVPGVTGRPVTSFLVSRDGTRFVAVVRGDRTDEVRVGRVQVDDRGRVAGVGPTTVVAPGEGERLRVKSLAWTSPTTLALLTPLLPGELFDVSTVAVDGSPAGSEALSTTVSDQVVGLIATPTPGEPAYAVTRTGLIDLGTSVTETFPEDDTTAVTYVG